MTISMKLFEALAPSKGKFDYEGGCMWCYEFHGRHESYCPWQLARTIIESSRRPLESLEETNVERKDAA